MNFELFGKIFFETIFVPSLHQYLKKASPEKYAMYDRNCCKQVAVFGSHFLTTMFPCVECVVWEGIFHEQSYNKNKPYNHAWILVKADGKRFFVDYARHHKECLFQEVSCNAYPNHPDYINMKEVSRERLDWRELFKENEWFTMKPSIIVAEELKIEMMKHMRMSDWG
jgi:hypothetical protein